MNLISLIIQYGKRILGLKLVEKVLHVKLCHFFHTLVTKDELFGRREIFAIKRNK